MASNQSVSPSELRGLIRQRKWTKPTTGLVPGFVQANLVILPEEQAFHFLLFCVRNPKPCPILDVLEPGSNHMGDVELAEEMIVKAARCGVNAVKLQKRDNQRMFTKGTLAKSYNNELSYGPTYGAHREKLDWFGGTEFQRLKNVAEDLGVWFFATPFEEESALFLNALGVPMFKIASCDVNNHPFLRFVASMQKPMVISTGGHTMDEIDEMVDVLDSINPNYALLHCVSLYPNEDKDLQLGYQV